MMMGLTVGFYFYDMAMKGLLNAPIAFFDVNPVGRILSRFSGDIMRLEWFNTIRMLMLNLCLATCVAQMVLICLASPYLLVLVVILVMISIRSFLLFKPVYLESQRFESVSNSLLTSRFSESLAGDETVTAYERDIQFLKKFQSAMDKNQAFIYQHECSRSYLIERLELIFAFTKFGVALAGCFTDKSNASFIALGLSYCSNIATSAQEVFLAISELEVGV